MNKHKSIQYTHIAERIRRAVIVSRVRNLAMHFFVALFHFLFFILFLFLTRKFLQLLNGDFNATSLFTYDFSTLYTTLPHNLIKDTLIDLIERSF